MIYTVTFNPSIDYFLEVEDFDKGKINRVKSNHKYPGGKGINVSRVLNRLGIKSKVLGFIGGFTGEFIEKYINQEGIDVDFIKVSEDTRINVKIKSKEETEINGEGPRINEKELIQLFDKISTLGSEDFLVLAGNLQNSLPRDIYSKIQEHCKDNNIKVVVDTTGESLTATLRNKPFLIKPNNHELGEIFGVEIKSKEDVVHYGKRLIGLGAENVIVSMGGEGAILITKAETYHAEPPKGTVRNSVGAGDSLIAGFIAEYSKSMNILEAFKWGVSSGSATAFSIDLCRKEDVEKLLNEVKITKLN